MPYIKVNTSQIELLREEAEKAETVVGDASAVVTDVKRRLDWKVSSKSNIDSTLSQISRKLSDNSVRFRNTANFLDYALGEYIKKEKEGTENEIINTIIQSEVSTQSKEKKLYGFIDGLTNLIQNGYNSDPKTLWDYVINGLYKLKLGDVVTLGNPISAIVNAVFGTILDKISVEDPKDFDVCEWAIKQLSGFGLLGKGVKSADKLNKLIKEFIQRPDDKCWVDLLVDTADLTVSFAKWGEKINEVIHKTELVRRFHNKGSFGLVDTGIEYYIKELLGLRKYDLKKLPSYLEDKVVDTFNKNIVNGEISGLDFAGLGINLYTEITQNFKEGNTWDRSTVETIIEFCEDGAEFILTKTDPIFTVILTAGNETSKAMTGYSLNDNTGYLVGSAYDGVKTIYRETIAPATRELQGNKSLLEATQYANYAEMKYDIANGGNAVFEFVDYLGDNISAKCEYYMDNIETVSKYVQKEAQAVWNGLKIGGNNIKNYFCSIF